ncbi:MAG: hypothetical protein ACLTYN_13320 [Dysosmobacter welbionis]
MLSAEKGAYIGDYDRYTAPTAIRRTVAFSQAIVLGETKVEDVTARRVETPEAAAALCKRM